MYKRPYWGLTCTGVQQSKAAKSPVLTKWHKVPIRVEHCKKYCSTGDLNPLKVDDEEQWEEMVCSLPSFWHDNCLAATTGANPSPRAGMSDCPGGDAWPCHVRDQNAFRHWARFILWFQLIRLTLFQFYWLSQIKSRNRWKSGQQTKLIKRTLDNSHAYQSTASIWWHIKKI